MEVIETSSYEDSQKLQQGKTRYKMNMKTTRSPLLMAGAVCAASLLACVPAMANTTVNSFGSLPAGNDFGGTGIPTDAVALSTTTLTGGDVITLGLSATPRGSTAPGLGHQSSSDTFFATAGTEPGGRSLWNFDYYINNADGLADGDTYSLTYTSGLKSSFFDPTSILLGNTTTSTSAQNSENLGFSIFGPAIGFNPNANGVYGFTLDVDDALGTLIASDHINVDVGVPDTASTFALLGAAFGGLFFVRRKMALVGNA
jgi:hypothetical protein